MTPIEPVTVWGDEKEPKLKNASAEMAAGYIDAADDPDALYVQDADDFEWVRRGSEWTPS
jgi:hypothetical protein